MSLESQVLQLQAKHKTLDSAFHEFQRIVQGTHDVTLLVLREQREYQGKTDYRLESLEKKVNNLERTVNDLFSDQNKRLDKIEDTLIQIINHLTK